MTLMKILLCAFLYAYDNLPLCSSLSDSLHARHLMKNKIKTFQKQNSVLLCTSLHRITGHLVTSPLDLLFSFKLKNFAWA